MIANIVPTAFPTRSTALQLPWPEFCLVRSGATVWRGGVHVLGPQIVIPGRSIHVEQVVEARRHAAAILAACDLAVANFAGENP